MGCIHERERDRSIGGGAAGWLDQLDGLAELHHLLQEIDATRARQRQLTLAIDRLLQERDLALYECYRTYRCSQGATVRDFEEFLLRYFAGKPVPCFGPKYGALRLVVTNAPFTKSEAAAAKPDTRRR